MNITYYEYRYPGPITPITHSVTVFSGRHIVETHTIHANEFYFWLGMEAERLVPVAEHE